jgi:HEAT repeat protein
MILATSVIWPGATPASAAPTAAEIEAAVAAARIFDYGRSCAAWLAIDRLINQTAACPELRAGIEREMVKLLESDATLAAKQEVCRRLWIIGTDASVPALARLLAGPDAHAAQAACYALSRRRWPAAAQALRDALGQARGGGLVAVVNLLGDRRDPQCAGALATLAGGSDDAAADAAIAALGKIATPEAIRALAALHAKRRDGRRTAAAHALLQAGQELAARGKPADARMMWAQLASPSEPAQVRRGALLGQVRTGGGTAAPLVLAALAGNDEALVTAAIASIPEIRGKNLGACFAAQLPKLSVARAELLIEALASRGDRSALPAIARAAGRPEPAVRAAALRALGLLGDASTVPQLIDACQSGAADQAKLAAAALRLLQGRGVDGAIVRGLESSSPAVRATLIDVLADRGDSACVPALLVEAASDQAQVRRAALRGLARIGGAQELSPLVRLLAGFKDDGDLAEAERAASRIVSRAAGSSGCGDMLRESLRTAPSAPVRCSLLRILATIAGRESFEAVAAALADGDPAVRDTAVRVLAQWPDRRAEGVLLRLVKSSPDQAERVLALRGYLRLWDLAADRPARERAQRLAAVMIYARRAEEKRLLVSSLSRVVDRAALDAISAWRDDADVRGEVALAAVSLARQLPAADRFHPLFDGKTWDGWEGNRKVFRIEGGAIVGGSLQRPLAHNEFLCTTRSYADFELRLKCKLLGTGANGGVQIRSQRVPHHHEVSGYQADMADGYWGNLYDESRRNRSLAGLPPAEQRKIVRADDWNDYLIRCQGRRIQLWINRRQTVDYTEPDQKIPQDGIIGLQIHGGPPAEAWYKDIELRALDR